MLALSLEDYRRGTCRGLEVKAIEEQLFREVRRPPIG